MNDIIYGIHAIEAVLTRSPERCIEIYYLAGRHDQRVERLLAEINRLGIRLIPVNCVFLDQKTQQGVHQGIMAIVKAGKTYSESDLRDLLTVTPEPLVLILDGVTDPHNLGACMRTADAAGVDWIIVPKDRSAPLNATVKKVACGAAESLPLIRVTNLARTLRLLQEYHIWIIGTAGEASRSLFETHHHGGLALVMGAEGEGLRRLTKVHCDELVHIPMCGSVSSLNVSVATGVCLFEIVRQKHITAAQ